MGGVKKFTICAILPHVKLYGGIKRFFELGNQFINLNHRFIAFTPEGERPAWFSFQGEVLPYSELTKVEADAIFFTELSLLPHVLAANAKRKIFYIVNPSARLGQIKKHPEIEFFANSTNLLERAKRKYKIDAFPAFGGVNLEKFWVKPPAPIKPNEPFTVLAYGRIAEGRKGTIYVVKACERLQRRGYDVRLLLFDTPVTEKIQKAIDNFKTKVPYKFILNHPVEKNVEFFHQANFFVAPEKKTGFANTVAEAMASGIPVIATTSGTKDLLIPNKTGLLVTRNSYRIRDAIIKLLTNHNLCIELTKNARSNIEKLDWSILAANIIENLEMVERRIKGTH